MKRWMIGLGLLLVACGVGAPAQAAQKPLTLPLWPGNPPGDAATTEVEKDVSKPGEGLVAGRSLIRLANVSKPLVEVFRPAKDKDTGAAVVIAPGGGYSILAWDLEGEEVAAWLNTLGVTGIVLKYRVPDHPKDGNHVRPLQDAQRAVSLARSRAKEWGLDPERIGVLGFSAGGHLAAATLTNSDRRAYEPVDEADRASCRPNFGVLIYPAYLTNKEGTALAPEIRVAKDTPPVFFAHASNDPIPSENSVQMYLALKRASVPAELHIYPTGGHGYGLRPTEETVTTWPQRCADWLKRQGLLSAKR